MNELATALAKAQGAIEGAKKGRRNDHFRSSYADLASVWDACREALSENGLSVVQFPIEAPVGHVGLRTILLHQSGQFLEDKFFMPVKDASNPQAVGSALTYARRYALASAVGIAPEDDDGNAAAARGAAAYKAQNAPMASQKALADQFQNGTIAARRSLYKAVNDGETLVDCGKEAMLAKFNEIINATAKGGTSK
jgi:hypothetical protein